MRRASSRLIRTPKEDYRHATQVRTPVHARRLNQGNIDFSIVRRKVLTRSDFADQSPQQERLAA